MECQCCKAQNAEVVYLRSPPKPGEWERPESRFVLCRACFDNAASFFRVAVTLLSLKLTLPSIP